MIKVNLLPKEIQERGKGTDLVILCGLVVFILVALTGASYFNKLQHYKWQVKKKTE